MAKNLYCKLYISCNFSFDKLFETINNNLHGEKSGFATISADAFELDLRRNREYDSKKANLEGAFLFWRYYANIEAKNRNEDCFISSIKNLIAYLVKLNIAIVASCDFEDELNE